MLKNVTTTVNLPICSWPCQVPLPVLCPCLLHKKTASDLITLRNPSLRLAHLHSFFVFTPPLSLATSWSAHLSFSQSAPYWHCRHPGSNKPTLSNNAMAMQSCVQGPTTRSPTLPPTTPTPSTLLTDSLPTKSTISLPSSRMVFVHSCSTPMLLHLAALTRLNSVTQCVRTHFCSHWFYQPSQGYNLYPTTDVFYHWLFMHQCCNWYFHQLDIGTLLDGGPLSNTLAQIKTFMDANPNEVRLK